MTVTNVHCHLLQDQSNVNHVGPPAHVNENLLVKHQERDHLSKFGPKHQERDHLTKFGPNPNWNMPSEARLVSLISVILGDTCGHVLGLLTTLFLSLTLICVLYMILMSVHQIRASNDTKNDEQ